MSDLLRRLDEARRLEKEQTLFYRSLAARAEAIGDARLSEALNELHADEQHHLSRLTARLLELGASPRTLDRAAAPPDLPELDGWEPAAREREAAEVERYEKLLAAPDLDDTTRAVLEEILAAERHHLTHLAGKWMSA